MNKLSKQSEKLLEAFDQDARDWGWTSDQGSYKQAEQSQENYLNSRYALEKRIAKLEKDNSQMRKDLRSIAGGR